MAQSEAEIANLALSHLGVSATIASMTERSAEARACSAFYEICRDETLRMAPWPFATRFATLALVEEDPIPEWAFSYRLPSDCFFLRKVMSGVRNDTRDTRVPYRIASDSVGKLLFTDMEDARCEYTVKVEAVEMFDSDFTMAVSLRLASMMAPRISAGDPNRLGDRALKLFQIEIANAQGNAFNEEQADLEPDSEFIRARN